MKEAYLYEKMEDRKVRCYLCNHRCLIKDGLKGICGVRENRGGTLFSLVYGQVIARHVDPIEKKPLFHFLPGTSSYSIATVGCNFKCLFCQNADISQLPHDSREIRGEEMTPEIVLEEAVRSRSATISYTYTEPTIFFEYAYDTAVLAKKAGIRNVFVTNGYITPEALALIRPFLDAANIDLKGFSERFYREVVHAMLKEVLDSIVEYKRQGIWIELTTLIIPGWNDTDEELRGIARFIAEKVGKETPWHVSRFHPTFKMTDRPSTPVATLARARQIGLDEGLAYVYEGNAPEEGGENTCCPSCGEMLIERHGFYLQQNRIEMGKCPACAAVIDGIEM